MFLCCQESGSAVDFLLRLLLSCPSFFLFLVWITVEGVSERLAVLIEGESLLNDAAAIVVFIVFRDAFVGFKDSSPLSVLETAARMSLGGKLRRPLLWHTFLLFFFYRTRCIYSTRYVLHKLDANRRVKGLLSSTRDNNRKGVCRPKV